MSVPTKITDHSDAAVGRLPAGSKGRANIEAFLRSKASGRFDVLASFDQKYEILINNYQYIYESGLFETPAEVANALTTLLNQAALLTDNFESYTAGANLVGPGTLGTWADFTSFAPTLLPFVVDNSTSLNGTKSISSNLASFPLTGSALDFIRAAGMFDYANKANPNQTFSFYFKIPSTYPGALNTAAHILHPAILAASDVDFTMSGVYMYYSAGAWKFDLSYFILGDPTKYDIATGFTFSAIADDAWHKFELAFDLAGTAISIDIDDGAFSGSAAFTNLGSTLDVAAMVVMGDAPAGAYTLPDTYTDDFTIGEPAIIVAAEKFDADDDFLYVKSTPAATALEVTTTDNLNFRNIGLVDQIQELEDMFFDLLLNRSIDTATGIQLDRIGVIVGLSRAGSQSDDDYRILLKVQIQSNLSNGEINRFIGILKAFTDSTSVKVTELFPAHVQAIFDGTTSDDIYNQMDAVLAGGVGLTLIQGLATGYFGFDGDPDALGFSSTLDTTSGGVLAGKVT